MTEKLDKPKKPYPDFPLTPHTSGKWCKRIRGQLHYFGAWATRSDGKLTRVPEDGWQAALDEYKAVADDLHAGRKPRSKTGELTVAGLCNRFLDAKFTAVENGELSPLTVIQYKITTDIIVALFGRARIVSDLRFDDFEALRAHMEKLKWGPVRIANQITRVRTLFRFAYEAGMIDVPMRFGPLFKKPSRSVLRRHRVKRGERMFEPAQIQLMIETATPVLKAMILLGINCAFGNTDIALLPMSVIDLENQWVSFPRPKTGIPRRCPIWTETAQAIREVIASRPKPRSREDDDLLFITRFGRRWVRVGDVAAKGANKSGDAPHYTMKDAVSLEFGKLMRQLKLTRPGLGFYSLRHTLRTIADSTLDFPAIRLIMGHIDQSIDATYRERIDDSRLVAISEHVRQWLFGNASKQADPGASDQATIKLFAG